MRGRRLKILWWITGLAVLLLLIITVGLMLRADQIAGTGIVAYVDSSGAAAFLREQPSGVGSILAVLEIGTPVRVTDSTTRDNVEWYFVNSGTTSGWLRASGITFEPPAER